MCHKSVLDWVPTALPAATVAGKRVLEVGSYDVNGSVRPLVVAHGPAAYIGIDQQAGPGVDQVVSCYALPDMFGPDCFEVVISTEMLEHVEHWPEAIACMVDVLAPLGLLMLTTRSPGFPFHPFPVDCWRYTTDGLAAVLAAAGLVDIKTVPDPQAPGVFATARKPAEWMSPWLGRSPAQVLPTDGVTAVVA